MARYIDADALLRVAPFTKRGGDLTEYTEGYLDCAADARAAIERAATADVEEVRHGKWQYNRGQARGEPTYFCSLCDTCKFDHCAGVTCPKFRKWFAVEWKRVTGELKPYFKKKGE